MRWRHTVGWRRTNARREGRGEGGGRGGHLSSWPLPCRRACFPSLLLSPWCLSCTTLTMTPDGAEGLSHTAETFLHTRSRTRRDGEQARVTHSGERVRKGCVFSSGEHLAGVAKRGAHADATEKNVHQHLALPRDEGGSAGIA